MREFAVLQRLFRAAFDGHLGPQFPTYRLTELAEVLGETPLGLVKTGRWSK